MESHSPFDLSVTDELLTTTRSVRRRLDLTRPVEPRLILECIDIAQQAPTGSNSQRWHFVVVTDPRKRAKLAELYREVGAGYLAQARAAAADPQTIRVYDSAMYLADVLARVPVHVIPCLRGEPPATGRAAAGYYANIMPAVWSFMLAARSRGLGTVWTTMTLARADEVAALLDMPKDVTQIALIPVGYYTGERFSPAARPAPETITSWNSWESPAPSSR
jgi:nitroreductase